jgi:hypothetical protein
VQAVKNPVLRMAAGYVFGWKEGVKFMSLVGLSGKQQRTILRYSHLLAGLLNVLFIYTPLGDVWAFQLLVQIILVPVIIMTGVWMWQQARVRKLMAKGSRQEEDQEGLDSEKLVKGEKKLVPREIAVGTKFAK